MLVHRRVTPSINSLVPIYTPGWREAMQEQGKYASHWRRHSPVTTPASIGNKPESKNASHFPWASNGKSKCAETEAENCFCNQLGNHMRSLPEQHNLHNTLFCKCWKESCHLNSSHKDMEHLWKRLVHEFCS